MARPAETDRNKKLDTLQGSTSVIGIDDLIQLLNSPKRLTWLRFYTGFISGVGGVLGAAVVIVILGLAVRYLGGVPWFGNLIREIGNAARAK